MVSSSHVVSVAPSSSGGGLLTLCPCSSMGSLSWETVFHELLQRGSFPQAAALHELPQRGSFPWGFSPSGTGCSSVGPHGVTGPSTKPAPAWAPLTTGPQVLAGACSCAVSPQGHSFLQASTFSGVGSLPRATGGYICSTVDLRGLQGHGLPHHGVLHELQENLCSSVWSTSSPSFLTNLGVCRVVALTSSHSSVPLQLFSHLNYIIPEVLPPLLIGLALASRRIHLGAGWHW